MEELRAGGPADIEALIKDKFDSQERIDSLFGWELASVHATGVKNTFNLYDEANRLKTDLGYLGAFLATQSEALKAGVQLETSSALDMPIIETLEKAGHLKKDIVVLCNGFKDLEYKQYIVDLLHDGFENIIPILDNKEELGFYEHELARRTDRFGDVMHIASAYETKISPDAVDYLERGVNSLQLVREQGSWKIVSLCWDDHAPFNLTDLEPLGGKE